LSSVSVLHGVAKVTELDDFAELLLDLTLEEDPSSQSSHTLDDDPSEGRVAKSLSSSPHATKRAAQRRTPNQRERIFPPFIRFKYKKKQFKGKPKARRSPPSRG
jgi:hypothetical protein